MYSISARIERVPFCRFHWNLLLMGGVSYCFDGLDSAVIAFVLPILRNTWNLSSVQIGLVGSSTYVGYFFGAMFAGMLGDVKGRRPVMFWAVVVYCAASLASAFTHSWLSFMAWRVIAGAGAGAEAAIVAPFFAEFIPGQYRGRFTGTLASFFALGYLIAALLGYVVVPASPQGWRYVLALTAVPVVMLLWWRGRLPESPRWLMGEGREAEAEEIVAGMENTALASGFNLPEPEASFATTKAASNMPLVERIALLWAPRLRKITAMCWLMWLAITFSYYAFFTWMPSLLVQSGLTIVKSFTYSLVIYVAMLPGYLSGAWMNEKIGRQQTIASYMALGAVSAIALSMCRTNLSIMIAGSCLSFFMNGTYAGVYAYTPEVFPTEVRATGMGISSAVGRLGAIASPFLVGWLYPHLGFAGVFGTTTLVLAIGAIAVLSLGIRTRDRSLENITEELAIEVAP